MQRRPVDVSPHIDLEVLAGDLGRTADRLDLSLLEDQRPLAVSLDRVHVVGDEDDRPALLAHRPKRRGAALLERRVADRQYLVEDQDVCVDLEHQRECQPDQHPRRVVLQLHLSEPAELGKIDHRVVAPARLARTQPHHHPIEDNVVEGGQLHVESDPELDERRQPPRNPDLPAVGAIDARQDLQQGALAGTVAPHDADELALGDVERDPADRFEHLVIARREHPQRPLLERVDPLDRDPERLVDVVHLDHRTAAPRHGRHPRRGLRLSRHREIPPAWRSTRRRVPRPSRSASAHRPPRAAHRSPPPRRPRDGAPRAAPPGWARRR